MDRKKLIEKVNRFGDVVSPKIRGATEIIWATYVLLYWHELSNFAVGITVMSLYIGGIVSCMEGVRNGRDRATEELTKTFAERLLKAMREAKKGKDES